ncbi:MAG: hypothetical protein R3194_13875, partial [Limnobacter sp.]|nr:hypothetical protein [Limnobacter sp.]
RKAWLYAVLAHEVGHCLHNHFAAIDQTRLGLGYSESVRRIEAEADIFGLYQAKQVFSAPVYSALYEQYMAMRESEVKHTHSTHPYLKLVPRIKPSDMQTD